MKELSTSIKIYLGLISILAILRVILLFLPVYSVAPGQEAMFAWPVIILVAVLGFIGLRLSPRTGFPEIWDPKIPNRQRMLIPALVGLGFGVASVLLDLIQPLGKQIHIEFPTSLVVYPFGGISEEIIWRLFLIPFLIWLISDVFLKGQWQEQIFWVVASLVALLYTLMQIGGYWTIANEISLIVVAGFTLFVGSPFLVAAYLFRRSGFLSSVVMRLSHYLLWHIIWGGLT